MLLAPVSLFVVTALHVESKIIGCITRILAFAAVCALQLPQLTSPVVTVRNIVGSLLFVCCHTNAANSPDGISDGLLRSASDEQLVEHLTKVMH